MAKRKRSVRPRRHPPPPDLLVALVLILLGLVRIETGTTQNQQEIALARHNALTAVEIAMGQLQEHTGPDTRVTAPADIYDDTFPKVIGAWKSWEGLNHETAPSSPALGRPIAPDYSIKDQAATSGDGRFISWLVSGAEKGQNIADPTPLISSTAASDGSTVPLLGAGSLGPSSGREVHVPFQEIEQDGDSQPEGAYAWWVSPENQKARITQPYAPRSSDPEDLVELGQSYSVPDPAVFGLENDLGDPETFVPDGSVASMARRVLNLASLALARDDNPIEPHQKFYDFSTTAVGLLTNTATGGWRKDLSILSEKWDSIYAADSDGLLPLFRYSPEVDDTSAVPNPTDTKPIPASYQPDQSNLYPWSAYSQLGTQLWPNTWHAASSSWQSLVNYATMYKNFSYNGGVVESPFIWSPVMKWRWMGNPNDATAQEFYDFNHIPRIHPIVARLQFIIYLKAEPDPIRPGRYGFGMIWSPVVTLWNPYNVRLSIDNPGPPDYGVLVGGQRCFPAAFTAERASSYPGGPETIPLNRYRMLTNGNMQYADTNGNFSAFGGYDIQIAENTSIGYEMSGTSVRAWRDLRTWGINLPTGPLTFEPGEVRMFTPNGNSEARFGTAAWETDSGYLPAAPAGIYQSIRNDNEDPNNEYYFNLKSEVFTQPFRFRSPGRGFHVAFGTNDGTSYTGGSLYNGVNKERMSMTALTNGGRAEVYWPEDDLEPHTYTVGEIASVPAIPIYSITVGPRFTIGVGVGTPQNRPTKGLVQSDPLAGISLIDPGVDNSNSHPTNGNFEMSYNTLAFGSTRTPNLSDREGFIVTGFQSGDGLSRIITHELPLRPMASLAELQAWNPRGKNPMPPYQSHLIGNSDATPMIPSNAITPTTMTPNTDAENLQHDDAYCANHLLFDDWFLSSIAPQPQDLGGNIAKDIDTFYRDYLTGEEELSNRSYRPNRDLTETDADTLAVDILDSADGWMRVASHLEVDGMFNINSTSVEAWKALLGNARSREQIALYGENGIASTDPANTYPVTRGSAATDREAGSGSVVDTGPSNATEFTGFRSLTDAQITDLAEKIVEQIRLRGPFLSLSEFINRQLSTDNDLAMAGAIQTAINNLSDDPMAELRNPSNQLSETSMEPSDPKLDGVGYEYEEAATGDSAYGAPNWIRQADILRSIAPIMSARDDTFTIRTYGDARDNNGNIVARAWCEAVVQRSREFVDSTDPADSIDTPTSSVNQTFGRKYIIKSIRWLNRDEV